MNNVKSLYEDLKSRSEVRRALAAVAQQIKEFFPDKTQAEIDGYVEVGFLGIVSLVAFFTFYLLLQMFCTCCCRKRSKLEEPTVKEEPSKVEEPEKKKATSSKKSSTPRKSKKSKGRK